MSQAEKANLALLVVDDDPGHRHLIERTIRQLAPQADIETVGTREELIRCVKRRNFDCALLDFHLGDCEADQLLQDLARHRPDCPAIVVSGCRDQNPVIRSMRNGSCDFVHKDEIFEGDLLWQRIQVAINRCNEEQRERRRMQRRERRLLELAVRDPLTGLLNRRTVSEFLRRNGRHVHDRRGTTSAVMMDLDHFKRVNDTWGHQVGDSLLKLVARTIKESSTASDIAVRWGGEEFLVIKSQTSLALAIRWAENLREDVARQTTTIGAQAVGTTISMGVASVASADFNQSTITRADEALYLAKHRGRNRVCTARMVDFQKTVLSLDSDEPAERLQEALDKQDSAMGPVQREHIMAHAERVSETVVALGSHLGLDGEYLERVRLAALCHDIGKLLIPENILSKRGRLTQAERQLIGRHAEDGAEMAEMLGVDKETVECIRHHHSRYDRQKSSIRAPLGAHLVNVADALDAMTSRRPYQQARSKSNALHELRRERGRQFDPAVVDAAIRAWRDVAPQKPETEVGTQART